MILTGRVISKKNSKQIFRTKYGKTFVSTSDAYKKWEIDALWQLKKYKEQHTGKISISITFELKGKLDSDLDNLTTSILDVLQKAEIIDDDKNVVHLNLFKYGGFKDWRTHIEIIAS